MASSACKPKDRTSTPMPVEACLYHLSSTRPFPEQVYWPAVLHPHLDVDETQADARPRGHSAPSVGAADQIARRIVLGRPPCELAAMVTTSMSPASTRLASTSFRWLRCIH